MSLIFVKIKNQKNNKGYVVLELLFYLSLFFVMSLALFNSIIVMTKSFQSTTINTDFFQSTQIIELLSREIKRANAIYTMDQNDITILTTNEVGTAITRRFRLNAENIEFYDNGTLLGNLNTTHIGVLDLDFTRISGARGAGVKIFMQIQSKRDPQFQRVENYYDTVSLRGDY